MKALILTLTFTTGVAITTYAAPASPPLSLKYACTAADGGGDPSVKVYQDRNANQFVKIAYFGSREPALIPLHVAPKFMIDGGIYVGSGVEVTEHNSVEVPPARATVVLVNIKRTFNCSPGFLK